MQNYTVAFQANKLGVGKIQRSFYGHSSLADLSKGNCIIGPEGACKATFGTMDVDDEEFGSPMPPSAEMDEILNGDINGNHAVEPSEGDLSTLLTHQIPSSTNESSQKENLPTEASNGLISSTTTSLRSSPYGAGSGDSERKPFGSTTVNGYYSDAEAKFTSREPHVNRIGSVGLHGFKFGNDVDGKLTNNFAAEKKHRDFFTYPKLVSHDNLTNDRQPGNDNSLPGSLGSSNARNSVSGLPRDNLDAASFGGSGKLLSSSAASHYYAGDSSALLRRTSESAACQQCSNTDSSQSFASALAKVSMLNQLSASGEDSGLGGGGVGSHEMAEIMHNYVRALHTSPAFQQFIQHRSASATAGGTSPGSVMMTGDSQHQEHIYSSRNHPHHAVPLESTTSSYSSGSAANTSKSLSPRFLHESGLNYHLFNQWSESEQVLYVEFLLDQMQHSAQSRVNLYLRPKLQRDFISLLPKLGMQHIAETILEKLDERELRCAEKVSSEWYRAIADGMQWKKLIERNVIRDTLWRGLGERRGWIRHLFKRLAAQYPAQMTPVLSNDYFRALFPDIVKDIRRLEDNWRSGKHNLHRINCRSENSKGVYCLQYDEDKIVSGLRDNTIKIWDKKTLQLQNTLKGHNGSVLCLQYDDKIIISGSSDATVRVWDVKTGEQLAHLLHHCEAVLHLRFGFGIMVTCSKDRSIAVWDMTSSRDINFRRNLVGHRAAVNVVDFDEKYIVSASGDRSIKVWNTQTCELVRNLAGHRRGIACLQYRDKLVVSGSSDYTIRIWDIELGHCLRVLEGHEELVRCIRFDNKRIVSGAYDGKIKVWDLEASLDVRRSAASLCIQTLVEHTGRVFRLQFDEFQIVSSSHDDTILIWDFFNGRSNNAANSIAAGASAQNHHGGGGGGAPPPADGGHNNNAGGGGGGAAPGGAANAHYYHRNMNAAGGAFPPPAGGGGGNEFDADLSDAIRFNAATPGDDAARDEPDTSDAVIMPPAQQRQRQRHHHLPANVAVDSVSEMMRPLQRLPPTVAAVGGSNNSSSASSSSASTPLSVTIPYFAADNIVISSHSSKDATVAAEINNDVGKVDRIPESFAVPGSTVTHISDGTAAADKSSGNDAGGSMGNIQPKLSQLELATASAGVNSRGSHPMFIQHLKQKQHSRPVTTSSSVAVGSGVGSPRLLSHSSTHVSSPDLLLGKNSAFANDDLAQQRIQPVKGSDTDFATAPIGNAGAACFSALIFAAPLNVNNPLILPTAADAPAGGDHGLYVRHKAKRSAGAAPVKYYRESGMPILRTNVTAPDAAKVLQQLPASLQTTGRGLIPTFPVATPAPTTAMVVSSSRPVSEADSSSTLSEVVSEPDSGGNVSSRLTSNDVV